MDSLVSILVPVYNAEKYLRQCIDSILAQTYRNLQVVIVDDGSKDNSLSICQNYASKDPRVEVYHQENQGVATTRNQLLKKVKGDYVLFIDADDWMDIEMVSQLVSLSNTSKADMVMCDRVVNDEKPSEIETKVFELDRRKAVEDFLYHKYFTGSLWNKLFKSKDLDGIEFHKEVSYGEDALFCWQILKKARTVTVTNKQPYHYRINENSLSKTYNGHQFSAYYVWEQIVNDVALSFPEYTSLAQAQFCNQMTVILYDAMRHGYKKDQKIKKLTQIVSLYKRQMRKHGCSIRKYIFAIMLCHHYSMMQLFAFKKSK